MFLSQNFKFHVNCLCQKMLFKKKKKKERKYYLIKNKIKSEG